MKNIFNLFRRHEPSDSESDKQFSAGIAIGNVMQAHSIENERNLKNILEDINTLSKKGITSHTFAVYNESVQKLKNLGFKFEKDYGSIAFERYINPYMKRTDWANYEISWKK